MQSMKAMEPNRIARAASTNETEARRTSGDCCHLRKTVEDCSGVKAPHTDGHRHWSTTDDCCCSSENSAAIAARKSGYHRSTDRCCRSVNSAASLHCSAPNRSPA
jgi:hypothetical protein